MYIFHGQCLIITIIDIIFNILVSYNCICAKHLRAIFLDDRAIYK